MSYLKTNCDSSSTDGSFTMANSNSSSSPQIFRKIFLFYHEFVCYVDSLESPHRDDSIEYTQHTIIV